MHGQNRIKHMYTLDTTSSHEPVLHYCNVFYNIYQYSVDKY